MLRRWRSRRAAKAYVTRLGPWLRSAFGTSATYKQGQIERGIRELRLDPAYALFGYALFLDRAASDALLGALPNRAAFEEARAALLRELGQRPQFDASAGGAGEDWPDGHGGHTHDSGGHHGGDGGWRRWRRLIAARLTGRPRRRGKRPSVKQVTPAGGPSA
jgi:hypothetical protein